jgi:hypothetical protein
LASCRRRGSPPFSAGACSSRDGRLGLPWYLAAGLFVVAEAAMLASAVRADAMHEAQVVSMHGRFVWTIAGALV